MKSVNRFEGILSLPTIRNQTTMAKRKAKYELIDSEASKQGKVVGNIFSTKCLTTFIPKTYPQEQFFKAVSNDVEVIMQMGSAGTGKTACAIYAALTDVFDNSTPYDKIIIIRSAVQARDIGFLKGDEDEKNEVYEAVYKSLCDELICYKSNNYDNLKAKHMIEFHNTSFLRGKTFDDTIIIVDECASMTYHELSTCVTRVGINSKIIFCGDHKQNDLHKKGDLSGLKEFLHVLEEMPSNMVEVVNYMPSDIIRGGICKEFLLAEERI